MHVRMRDDFLERFNVAAERAGVSQSEAVRSAMLAWCERRETADRVRQEEG